MAGIRQPIENILSRIRSELPQFQTVRVWNNQIEIEKEGQYVAYEKPAVFLEVMTDAQWEQLGQGYSIADLGIRFHIVHEYYDDQAGNFEQDLVVFDLRDAIIQKFMLYKPTGCGDMMKVSEQQDSDHTNIYHYIIEFVCSFVDDKGAKTYATTTPPTVGEVTAQFIAPKNYLIIP